MKVYKNERTKELLKIGEKARNEKEELELRMSTVPIKSKGFPSKEGTITYPTPSNYVGNPLYRTSNMDYGTKIPTSYDLPSKELAK